MKTPIWNVNLAAACRAIAADLRRQDESRQDLAEDIRARAQEFAQWAQPGIPLTDVGVGMMQALRSRLADPIVDFKPAADVLEAAWSKAWEAESADSWLEALRDPNSEGPE